MNDAKATRRREEFLELLREEYRHDFTDSLVEGGLKAILAEYRSVIPSEIQDLLCIYDQETREKRQKILTEAGRTLRQIQVTKNGNCKPLSAQRQKALRDWIWEWRNVDRSMCAPEPTIWTGVYGQENGDRWAKPHSVGEVLITHAEYCKRKGKYRHLLDTLA